jgi:Kef-type K+ transport system membrane component KefB/nucleotide-binding universal stress UspA family protein
MELIFQVLTVEPTTRVYIPEPLAPFVILLLVILVVPILFERLRLPALVGLVLSGIVFGPYGWHLLQLKSPILNLLADIGLIYLLFVAGLEADLEQFRRQKKCHTVTFSSLSFGLPLGVGIFIGRSLGFDWIAAILIGCTLASYTLVAYPLINRLGVLNNEAIRTTAGASIFSDFGVLLILAVCLAVGTKHLHWWQVIQVFNSLAIYSIIILAGCNWAGKEFFRRFGDDEANQFLFVLLCIFVVLLSAQLMGIEKILGAFLAGLTVNQLVGEGPVKEKVAFAGSVLFIPIFFVFLGLFVNLPALIKNTATLQLTFLLVVSLAIAKFIAALVAKMFARYNWLEMLTMWSLSLPQVVAALTVVLLGHESGLLPTTVVESAVLLMLVTSTAGPSITSLFAGSLTASALVKQELPLALTNQETEKTENNKPFTIVVPVYNPQTQQYLIEMAVLLARQVNGRIIPLAIATAASHMDAPQLEMSVQRSERLLSKATALSETLGVKAEPLLRIDDAFAQGISRAAREQKANLIIMGWGKRTGLRARLFGNVIDGVVWASHCPVAVTRLVESPKKIQRILVPVENVTAPVLQPVQFAQILAETNQAQVTVLNVCDRRTSSSKIAWRRSQLAVMVSKLTLPNPPEIQIMAHENITQAILQAARLYDLVVLPFVRNRTTPGGLAMSDVTTQLASQLTCSIVMLGEPQRTQHPTFLAATPKLRQLAV